MNSTRLVPGSGGDTLVLSMRELSDLVAFCLQYEFEDVITNLTGADRIDVGDRAALELSRRAYKLMRFVSGSRRLARACAPRASTVKLERDYELFFPVFNNAYELFALAAVPDWRKRCRFAACYINEVWAFDIPGYLLELLAEFDHVFLGTRNGVEDVARIVGRPCSYLPLAVDVLGFSPLPQAPPRVIDVCNIGRRSPVTHEALMRLARERQIFYYHDTIVASGFDQKQRTFHVDAPSEHRLLLAGLLQRTRYFIANRALVNERDLTIGRDEISGRYYEGAAAGTVMIGEPPRTKEFEQQFGWTDAVIPMPFESPDVGRVLAELDADPQRLMRIRRENVRNAALRHDWVYRLRTVFEMAGMPLTEAMVERQVRLRAVAGAGPGAPPPHQGGSMVSTERGRTIPRSAVNVRATERRLNSDVGSAITRTVGSERQTVPLLGVNVDALTIEETIEAVRTMVRSGVPHQHVGVNAALLVESERDPELRSVINRCDLVSADGISAVLAGRLFGRPLPERVAGVDLFQRLVDVACRDGSSVYFLGATSRVVERVARVFSERHPGLVVAGYRDGYWHDDEEVINAVRAARPDYLFLAIPSPRKELWLSRNLDLLGVPFVMGVGGSFDVVAGKVSRAPRWVQNVGFEWAWRLGQEPRRMWRRYLFSNAAFLRSLAREYWMGR